MAGMLTKKRKWKVSDNPWDSIAIPHADDGLKARRINPSHPYEFFWARDIWGKYVLVLRYEKNVENTSRRPKLHGLEIIDIEPVGGHKMMLLVLKDHSNEELFYRLCNDIIEATAVCESEASAVTTMLNRTWRWHSLLRGGAGRLGPEKQKGLIGELIFLEKWLLERFSPNEIFDFWTGPSGAPRDFTLGQLSVEVKSRRGNTKPFVKISSLDQLDTEGLNNLFLYVVQLNEAAASDPESFNLDDMLMRVRNRVLEIDPGAESFLDMRLGEVGYSDEEDYSDLNWILSGEQIFHVHEGFPRIIRATVPAGIQAVEYQLDITSLDAYQIGEDILNGIIGSE